MFVRETNNQELLLVLLVWICAVLYILTQILCGGGENRIVIPIPRPAPFDRRSARIILGLTLTPGLFSSHAMKLFDCCWKLEGSGKWVEEDIVENGDEYSGRKKECKLINPCDRQSTRYFLNHKGK